MPEVVAVITARGGSQTIPRKNVLDLAGKPVIAWTIEAARASRQLDRVFVSTDDPEIAAVARAWGAEVPFMRPSELSRNETPHILVVLHALQWLEDTLGRTPDYLLMLQPTSPLRTAADIDAAIDLAEARQAVAVVGVIEAPRHPYLCKRVQPDGTLADFFQVDIPYLRRQDLPLALALNGALYLNRPQSLRRDRTFTPAGTLPYVMPPERSIDLDTPWDFHLAGLVLRDRSSITGAGSTPDETGE